jgi:hypothetical protein
MSENRDYFMKISVTITTCYQIGIETWRNVNTTMVFEETTTVKEINDWLKSIDKNATLSSCLIGVID